MALISIIKLMQQIYKIISKIFYYFLLIVSPMSNIRYYKNPLLNKPNKSEKNYVDLANFTSNLLNNEIDLYEKDVGYKIDKIWLDNLALKTQIVIKSSKLNYAHGRVLYTALRKYIKKNDIKKISILETGTARGFSSLCMAKALQDSEINGIICTFDLIPHNVKMFWNTITDHKIGKITREELLSEWDTLIEKFIIFIQGYSYIELPKVKFKRINFAFLDGAHSYKDVIFEFNQIKNLQLTGDIIIFDDYNKKLFPGIVKAVDKICLYNNYKKKIINTIDERSYVIAEKL